MHDLSYLTNPEWTTEENRLACFTGVFNAAIYADYIIAPSRNTLEQFQRAYPHYPVERAAVLPLASRFQRMPVETQDFASLQPRAGGKPLETQDIASIKPGGFWLNVGTPEPRKNQIRLLQAYARFKAGHPDAYPLVFAGGNGWMLEQFDHTIDELGLRPNVNRLGYVDDATLHWLYRNCYAFVYPALLEGFGLPVLEAMSLGAATITANITSMPEIAGDAALQVDPYREDAILGAMEKLAADEGLRQALKVKAVERARAFNWQSYAQGVLAICETLTNKGEH